MDSLLVLTTDQQKVPSVTQTITLNSEDGSNFQTISGAFSNHLDQSFKDFVVLGSNNNAHENQLYLILPSDQIKPVINNQSSVIFSPCSPHSQLYIKESINQDNQIISNEKQCSSNLINSFSNSRNGNIINDISIQNSPIFENTLSVKLKSQNDLVCNVHPLRDLEAKTMKENNIANRLSLMGNTEERLLKRDSLIQKQSCHRKRKNVDAYHKNEVVISTPPKGDIRNNCFNVRSCWSCILCDANFNAESELHLHEMMIHGEVRPFRCPHCVNSFAKQNLLEYHIQRIHRSEKPFKCSFCEQKFFRSYDLKMHLNLHLGIKTYICHICSRQFSHPSNLFRHIRIHTGEKPYLCKICGSRFSQICYLRAHSASHSSGATCTECKASFRSLTSLRRHIKMAHDKQISMKEAYRIFNKNYTDEVSRKYYCTVCGETFRYKMELKLHEKKNHSDGSFPCQNCFRIFQSLDNFKLHSCINKKIRSHYKNAEINYPSVYVCDSCLLSFPSYSLSKCHTCKLKPKVNTKIMAICAEPLEEVSLGSTNENYQIINYEGLIVLNLTSIKDGITCTVVKNEANNENEPFNNSREPLIDIFDNDLKEIVTITLEENTTAYNAQPITTSSIFSSLSNSSLSQHKEVSVGKDHIEPAIEVEENKLTKHKNVKKRTKLKIMDVTEETENKMDSMNSHNLSVKKPVHNKKLPFKCPECTKTFPKKWNLQQHQGLHDASLRKYICNECGLSFSYRSTYAKHLASHSLVTSIFTCSLCPKSYKHKNALIQHVKRKHERQCNYTCIICKKGFYNKSEHSYHMRIHRKEFPYMCFACGKEFSHVSHLHRHERIHTGEKPHKCPHCPKAFIQAVTLRIHLKKHEETSGSNNKIVSIISEEVVDGTIIQDINFPCEEQEAVPISLDSLSLPAIGIETNEEPFTELGKKELTVYPLYVS